MISQLVFIVTLVSLRVRAESCCAPVEINLRMKVTCLWETLKLFQIFAERHQNLYKALSVFASAACCTLQWKKLESIRRVSVSKMAATNLVFAFILVCSLTKGKCVYVFKATYYKTFYSLTRVTALSAFSLFESDFSGVFLGQSIQIYMTPTYLAHKIQPFKPTVIRVRRFKKK